MSKSAFEKFVPLITITHVLFAVNCTVPASAGVWEAPESDAVVLVSYSVCEFIPFRCSCYYREKSLCILCWKQWGKFACCSQKSFLYQILSYSFSGTTWMTLCGQMCLCATSQRLLHVPVSTSPQESWTSHYPRCRHGSASSTCLRRTSRMCASGYSGSTIDQRWVNGSCENTFVTVSFWQACALQSIVAGS